MNEIFVGILVGIAMAVFGQFLKNYISKPDALKERAVEDRARVDKDIEELRNAITQHVRDCNETPNSTILSEMNHVRGALTAHAEADKEVSERIHAEISDLHDDQKATTRELNQELKAQRMAIEALTIGQETLKIMLQNLQKH
jgi:2-oxo-4-hydroxy-4-carboxy--5-ureidoimidazoline (OHCU) decarboxylase